MSSFLNQLLVFLTKKLIKINYLLLLLHHLSHKSHLSHWCWDWTDNNSWSWHTFFTDNNFINIWLKFIFEPQWKTCNIFITNFSLSLILLFFWVSLFSTFQSSFNIFMISFNIWEFKSFKCNNLSENKFINMSSSDKNWNASFS